MDLHTKGNAASGGDPAGHADAARRPDSSVRAERADGGRRRRAGWRLALLLAGLLPLAAAAALLLALRLGNLPAADMPQSTRILGADGSVLSSLQGGVNRRTVGLADISPWLVKATLAVEDRRFYEHGGVDLRGLARAAWVDARHLSREQGASTLTQQLARNLYLSHERTWTRKLKEAWYAALLEREYSKDKILELYLNQIYYGNGAYGAEAAAQLYFGKPAAQLSLAESALLAGIPKGPRYYSPYTRLPQARQRQRIVLQSMAESGAIDAAQRRAALAAPIAVRPPEGDRGQTAPYFADYVRKLAASKLGIEERLVNEGGLQIYTTLDSRMQREAEAAVERQMPKGSQLQAALVSIDPATGQIKAMVGGRRYVDNPYNRVFAATRQPGSSFKAVVYAAALDSRAVTAATSFRSEPTVFYYDNYRKVYRPSNYNDRYFGADIGLRQAIGASDNIFAVQTLMKAGPDTVIEMARRLGITARMDAVPSLALGTFPVSPFEMASAYSVFAAGGVKREPTAILRIADNAGRTLYEAQPKAEQALSPALSYVVTDLLGSVFEPGGTARRVAHMLHRPTAGKSGTTSSDAWFVGYTPDLVTAVWVGYDKGKAITSTEAHRAAPIFAEYTEAALADAPPHPFVMPAGVVAVDIDPASGLLASDACPARMRAVFLAGTEPTGVCGDTGDGGTREQDGPRSLWSKLRGWWRR